MKPKRTLYLMKIMSEISFVSASASRECREDGTWFTRIDTNTTWTNYTACMEELYDQYSHIREYVPKIKFMALMGYAISLAALFIALIILATVKKLRCPRNHLHIQLFISFTLRATFSLLKSFLFIKGVGLQDDFLSQETIHATTVFPSWECKVFIALWQYFLMANYCWILMEGLYLHNLIFLAMFSDTSGVKLYIILGWGLPLFFIIPWAVSRILVENNLCWTTNSNTYIFWLIRGPTTTSIVINFVFFINITRVLFLKLKSSYCPDSRKYRYRKLAKSTLVLVPLFGVHYVLFLVVSTVEYHNPIVGIIGLFCDQFFSSFQGFFVAILYCFMNGEVRQELRKKWKILMEDHYGRIRGSHSSFLTQSLSYVSKAEKREYSHVDQSSYSCTFVSPYVSKPTSPKHDGIMEITCEPTTREDILSEIDPLYSHDGGSQKQQSRALSPPLEQNVNLPHREPQMSLKTSSSQTNESQF